MTTTWVQITEAAVVAAMPTDLAPLYSSWISANPDKATSLARIIEDTVLQVRNAIRTNKANTLDDDATAVPQDVRPQVYDLIHHRLSMEMAVELDTSANQVRQDADQLLRQISYGKWRVDTAAGEASPRYTPPTAPRSALPAIFALLLAVLPASGAWVRSSSLFDYNVITTYNPTNYWTTSSTLVGHLSGIDAVLYVLENFTNIAALASNAIPRSGSAAITGTLANNDQGGEPGGNDLWSIGLSGNYGFAQFWNPDIYEHTVIYSYGNGVLGVARNTGGIGTTGKAVVTDTIRQGAGNVVTNLLVSGGVITQQLGTISAGSGGPQSPLTNNLDAAGYAITNATFSGNGSGLTNVNAATLGGLASSAFLQGVAVATNGTGNAVTNITASGGTVTMERGTITGGGGTVAAAIAYGSLAHTQTIAGSGAWTTLTNMPIEGYDFGGIYNPTTMTFTLSRARWQFRGVSYFGGDGSLAFRVVGTNGVPFTYVDPTAQFSPEMQGNGVSSYHAIKAVNTNAETREFSVVITNSNGEQAWIQSRWSGGSGNVNNYHVEAYKMGDLQ